MNFRSTATRNVLHTIVALVLPVLAVPAFAEWPASGKFVLLTTDSFHLTLSVWITELPNGDLLVRAVGSGGLANGYDVQRISAFGDLAPGWPARGVSFGTLRKAVRDWERGATVDESGSTWMVTEASLPMSQSTLGARKVDATGVLTPPDVFSSGWPLTTLAITDEASAFAPAPGGIYACFGARTQRLTASGSVAPGWPANGVIG